MAVLGGGAAGLAAAHALSAYPEFEITVYQMGWRLGGKGASGRKVADGSGRDQEHGLHVLGGFYHNALQLLRSLYVEWGQASALPLRFEDVFLPQSRVHIMERSAAGDFPVLFPFPTNGRGLGREPIELDLASIAKILLDWVFHRSTGSGELRGAGFASDPDFQAHVRRARDSAVARPDEPSRLEARSSETVYEINHALAYTGAHPILPPPPNAEHDPDYSILFDIALVVAKGIVVDGLWRRGFDAANGEEFTDWMRRHGLSERSIRSSYFRCGYDYAFAYVDGEPDRPRIAAGAALRGFLRMLLTYNRAVFVHMLGGMGEIVFTPLYEVLKRRGVRFEFFHRIDQVELAASGGRIGRIAGTVQAHTPGGQPYEPLVRWGDRLVWPDAPLDDQLETPPPRADRAEHVYESPWTDPPGSTHFELQDGRDFDEVVLAISVGALPDVTRSLVGGVRGWGEMLDRSATTPTLAAQLWLDRTTEDLGWLNGQTVLTAYRAPLSTWADMSFLLNLEAPSSSRHLSYFCGPCPRALYQLPGKDSDFGPPETVRAETTSRSWLDDNLSLLLPNANAASSRAEAGGLLYVRLNSYPSDEYVLTLPGDVQHRLPAGATSAENLFVAGDWTRNGYDIGSFETAVASGLQCARAMLGGGGAIFGERDLVR